MTRGTRHNTSYVIPAHEPESHQRSTHMLQFEKHITMSSDIGKYIDNPDKTIFFDIETTGLHHKYSYLYMIGVLFQDNGRWTLRQWFATKPTDEIEVLSTFMDFLLPDSYLIHYNGGSFDIPYVKSRCAFHGIPTTPLDDVGNMDIYRLIRPYQKKLGLEKLTQKSVEQFIGLKRLDEFSGKELINMYKKYLQSGDEILLEQLLLHNQEDVLNMSALLSLMAYQFLFEGHYSIKKASFDTDSLIVDLELEYPLNHSFAVTNDKYTLTVNHDTALIKTPIQNQTLKYYYSNYQDYYYLPSEDKSIHKSVASYVDKEHRIQATADNCYQRIACNSLDLSNTSEIKAYIDQLLIL